MTQRRQGAREYDGSSVVAGFVMFGVPLLLAALFIMMRYGVPAGVIVAVLLATSGAVLFAVGVLRRLNRLEDALDRRTRDVERNG
ncbi:MAG TPA: hypothetical protein VM600_10065 [Actinomycetota bacterium]|nr:hypothetical protein [Actinomycetota bacterium]